MVASNCQWEDISSCYLIHVGPGSPGDYQSLLKPNDHLFISHTPRLRLSHTRCGGMPLMQVRCVECLLESNPSCPTSHSC
jgi:hypothetical protein